MSQVLRCSGYELIRTDMVRAEGNYLLDARGRRYLDLEAGDWCTALGHNHPRVNRVLRDQLDRISNIGFRYTTDVVEEAAAAVLETTRLTPGKCVFLNSGSEAVEFATQAARRLSDRPFLLTMSDSFLGSYGSAGRKNPEEWHCLDWLSGEGPESVPFGKIGGLVLEPGSSGGLVRFPPADLVRTVADEVRRRGGVIVVNEVTTGVGRTGAWYGHEHYGLRPDIVALGKGLGNGYPVSAVAVGGDVAARLLDDGLRYAQSHQNDPLGCAAAREVLAVMREERLVEKSRRLGERFLDGLKRVGEGRRGVREVRGRGLMLAMELIGEPGKSAAMAVYRELLDRGYLAGCKPQFNLLRFLPPLTLSEEEVDRLLEDLDDCLPTA